MKMKTNSQQTAHTPGQWTWNGFAAPKSRILVGGLVVAEVWALDESVANGRLIAAAPELLAALERLDESAGRYQADTTSKRYFADLMDAHDQARAAIAKATGGAK